MHVPSLLSNGARLGRLGDMAAVSARRCSKAFLGLQISLQPLPVFPSWSQAHSRDGLRFSDATHVASADRTDAMTVPSGKQHQELIAVFSDR